VTGFKSKIRRWLGPIVIAVFCTILCILLMLFWQMKQADLFGQQELKNRLAQIAVFTLKVNPPSALPHETFFHEGQTADIVAAHILTDLKLAATTQSIEILRSGTLPSDNNEGTASTTVFVEISGPEAAIYRFLRQVEISQPLLFITKLLIRSNAPIGTEETFEQPLTVELTLNGVMMPKAD
jgi:Type II secretion system (T2SS), protein M subtype b